MSSPERYRVLALSAAKHDYVPLAFKDHPRFQVTGVSDEPSAAGWVHECNEQLAADLGVPYEPGIDAAIARHRPHVAVVSSEAARHARLSVRAAQAGLHVVQDKPMAPTVADCDAIVEAVERAGVRFLLWNRNTQPAIEEARQLVYAGEIGEPRAIHVDFFFSKDAGVLLDSDEPEGNPRQLAQRRRADRRRHLPPRLHAPHPGTGRAPRLWSHLRPLLQAPCRAWRGRHRHSLPWRWSAA